MRKILVMVVATGLLLAFAVPAFGGGRAVQVAAQVGWTPVTQVNGPATLTFQATGNVHTASVPFHLANGGPPPVPGSGPAGGGGQTCAEAIGSWYSEAEYGPCFAWDAYFGELVWRVGGGPGTGLDGGSEIVIPDGVSGTLYLAVNDYAYTLADNSGSFTVTFR